MSDNRGTLIWLEQQTRQLLRAWIDRDEDRIRDIAVPISAAVKDPPTADPYRQWLTHQGILPILAGILQGISTSATPSIWHSIRQQCVCRSLQLQATAHLVSDAMNAWGGDWCFVKGFSLAHRKLYEYPWMRLGAAADLDVLVRGEDQAEALKVLYSIGSASLTRTIQAHEQTLRLRGVHIDLHNAPMSHGRLRVNPVHDWLSHVQRIDGSPVLSANDELVLSLIHPAVTEYLEARLVRMLDVALLVHRASSSVDWEAVVSDIRRLGLRNAAFATALRVNRLFDQSQTTLIPNSFVMSLGIGWLRRRYWRLWQGRRPDRLYARRPILAGLLFNLWLNDSPRDLIRALFWRVGHCNRRRIRTICDISVHNL